MTAFVSQSRPSIVMTTGPAKLASTVSDMANGNTNGAGRSAASPMFDDVKRPPVTRVGSSARATRACSSKMGGAAASASMMVSTDVESFAHAPAPSAHASIAHASRSSRTVDMRISLTRTGQMIRALAVLAAGASACAGGGMVPASDARVAIMGRVARADRGGGVRIGYPGVTLRVRFEAPSLAMRVAATTGVSRFAVAVDGDAPRVVRLAKGESEVVLADGLAAGAHTAEIVHRTETWQGIVTVRGFVLGQHAQPDARWLPPPDPAQRRLLFVGDSVTCGEATDRRPDCADKADTAATSSGALSYGMLLGHALGAQVHLVCFGGRGLVRDWRGKHNVLNGPALFEAALPIDGRPVPWDHAAYTPDAVVVSLGTNDFNLALGALPERGAFVAAYVAFVRAIRARHPDAHVFLTEGAIVNDDKDALRPQKTVLRSYIADTVRAVADRACTRSKHSTTRATPATSTRRAPSTKPWRAIWSPCCAPRSAGSGGRPR